MNFIGALLWIFSLVIPLQHGSATFWTSGLHLVQTRFQRAATIPADQKRNVFARNSGLFFDESVAKTIKKGFRHRMSIISAVYCCISIIEKRKKVAGRMTIKGRGAGKMPWQAASGTRTVGCRLLHHSNVWDRLAVFCFQKLMAFCYHY